MKDFVPLYQTVLWFLLILFLIVRLWRHVDPLIQSILLRIVQGSAVTVGPVILGPPPIELPKNQTGAVTTEGKSGSDTPTDLKTRLKEKKYPEGVSEGFFLVHVAEVIMPRTTPRSGRYRVRIWLESDPLTAMADIESVTYRLYDDFSPQIISTTALEQNFELWLSIYGEFNVIAVARRHGSNELIWLTRFLDLPGRPPD